MEQCRRERLPIPNSIQNAPDLHMGSELYYGAFVDLSTCRIGMGDGPISWMAVHEYATIYELNEEQTEDLHHYITQMDEAFREWNTKKNG